MLPQHVGIVLVSTWFLFPLLNHLKLPAPIVSFACLKREERAGGEDDMQCSDDPYTFTLTQRSETIQAVP